MDVIHTDAAKGWANGFGLYDPLGHVDYFPNGGHNQPGCTFVRASLIVSHFGKYLFSLNTHSFESNKLISSTMK